MLKLAIQPPAMPVAEALAMLPNLSIAAMKRLYVGQARHAWVRHRSLQQPSRCILG